MAEQSPVKFLGHTTDGMRMYQLKVSNQQCRNTGCPFKGKTKPIPHRTHGLHGASDATKRIFCANTQPPFTGCTTPGRYGTAELTTNEIPEGAIADAVPCLGGDSGSNGDSNGNGHQLVGSGSFEDRMQAVYRKNGDGDGEP
ncbi:hypothetical protein JW978_03510 [Candidatus Dojkabacteria bacterium]|nr:hypothetical protein [Candidatus Dojkabacteria bacterium]